MNIVREPRVMKNLSKFRQITLGEIVKKDRHGLVDGPFGSNLPASEYTAYVMLMILSPLKKELLDKQE